ncbi:hypothetical protein Pcinc_015944 [Petrolisthes cinctipes]|uniref:Uncharacterized protein n=1 Tax=Petrolisthes cinctipes TaxID=88211 RepID=A0AAE1KMI5_PETCI|nr:hypothetical protein Pcinc_015944 [Petrolisthes cinctipes]
MRGWRRRCGPRRCNNIQPVTETQVVEVVKFMKQTLTKTETRRHVTTQLIQTPTKTIVKVVNDCPTNTRPVYPSW